MGLIKQFRIWRLKRRARKLIKYIHFRSSRLSCGARVAKFIRPDISRAIGQFNLVMVDLAELDPAAKQLLERQGPLT